MRGKTSDYIFHPPVGSSVPGKEEANPYVFFPPDEIRRLLPAEKDEEKARKMRSALKQWERQFDGQGYPFRKRATIAGIVRKVAAAIRLGEVPQPAINLNYYQDAEKAEGFESILDSLGNVHDQYNIERFDYNRQGERPERDVDGLNGDWLTPSDPVFEGGVVKPRGDGADPEGMDYPFPPTGGPIDAIPDML